MTENKAYATAKKVVAGDRAVRCVGMNNHRMDTYPQDGVTIRVNDVAATKVYLSKVDLETIATITEGDGWVEIQSWNSEIEDEPTSSPAPAKPNKKKKK